MLNVFQKYDWQKDRGIGWILNPREGGVSSDDRLGRIVMYFEA